MSRTLRITMKDELAERIGRTLKTVREKMMADGDPPPTVGEVIENLIMVGLVSSETSRGAIMGDGRRVGDLTLRELLQATGIADAARARANAVEVSEMQEKAAAKMGEAFADVQKLAILKPARLRTVEDVNELAANMKDTLGPGHAIALMYAIVEDSEPIPTTKAAPGIN